MILRDTLHNYFINTYDALSVYCLIEQLVLDDINEKEEFWKDDYIDPILVKAKEEVSSEFEKEYKELCRSNQYFYLCPIKIFEETYKNSLENSDLDEITFISEKLEVLLRDESVGSFLNPLNKAVIADNRTKQIEFLGDILEQKYHLNYSFNGGEFRLNKLDVDQLDSVLEKYPDVFNDRQYYLSFLKLQSDYIEGRIQDHKPIPFWSYIKACLVDEGMLRRMRNRDFIDLLNEHDLLTDNLFDQFLANNYHLYSKKKSFTEPRSKIFKTYFK